TPSASPSKSSAAPVAPTPPVALPAYRKATREQPDGGPSMVSLMLLITAPAVLAVAILRPRSR
ncbi:hypothetical protein GA0115259_110815, partial [Streptomyces sp. MnatMP-M17]